MKHENELNDEQQKILGNVDGVKLVVSGPGTGKTKTVTHFLAEILALGKAAPEEILAVTFTNKAADEMKERIVKMTEKRPRISTIHSLATAFLREFPPEGFTKDFRIIEDREQYRVVEKMAKDMELEKHPSYIIEKLTLARNLRDPKMLKREGLSDFYNKYFQYLKSKDSIDFDGLLSLCLDTLKKNPEALEAYRRKFKYVLVDEFQDISPIQYDIIRLIVEDHKNLLCVGDFDQSIYRFRGADVKIMLNFHKDLPVELFFLEQNYRSTKQIVNAANNLIRHNRNRQEKPHWTERAEGVPHSIRSFKNTEEEAQFIASRIKEKVTNGLAYKDIAVLYRINALSQELESALSSQNIPYQIIGGTGYFQRREIQDVLCFFRLAADPSDSASLTKARSVLSRINPAQKTEILKELLEGLEGEERLPKIFKLIIEHTGYQDYLKRDTSSEGERRLENLEKLGTVVDRFSNNLSEFLQYVDNTQEDEHDVESVKLLTIHAAKGLEFDTVFIAGAMEGMLPYYKNTLPEELEEERRMFYVAVTRAINDLIITYPKFNGKAYVGPSPFIEEMKSAVTIVKEQGANKEIQLGSNIEHRKFGKGQVIAINKDHNGETEVKVKFQTSGVKKFLLDLAPIKVV